MGKKICRLSFICKECNRNLKFISITLSFKDQIVWDVMLCFWFSGF
jgi:hypothetical protein